MKKGMAEEIQKLQVAKRNGQLSLFDVYDTDTLLDIRPCIFDRVDRLVWDDDTWTEEADEFDPEVD
jgi:hypothetical protein